MTVTKYQLLTSPALNPVFSSGSGAAGRALHRKVLLSCNASELRHLCR